MAAKRVKQDQQKSRLETLLSEFSLERDRLQQDCPRYGPHRVDLAAEAVRRVFIPALGWSGRQLGAFSGIPSSQVTEWLRGGSRLGADEICRVAWAIAGGLDRVVGDSKIRPEQLDEVSDRDQCRSHLDFLLNSLLGLAGYSSGHRMDNIVWRQHFDVSRTPTGGISDQTFQGDNNTGRGPLKVGWFPWGPLMATSEVEGTAGAPVGPAAVITEYVCGLLGKSRGAAPGGLTAPGTQTQWKEMRVHFQDVEDAVRSRSVDLFSPLLVIFPGRYSSCRFSDPVPFLRVRMAAVLPKAALENVATVISDGVDGRLPVVKFNEAAIELVLPPGELSAHLQPLVFPNAQVAPLRVVTGSAALGGVIRRRHLVNALLAESPAALTRVMLTNKPNALLAQDQNPAELVCVTTEVLSAFSFQLGFSMSPDEPRLLGAVNAALDVLQEAGVFARVLLPYARQLRNGGFELDRLPDEIG